MVLDPQDSPEETTSREVELSLKVGLLLLQLFLNSCATDIVLVTLLRTAVETAIAWYTSCYVTQLRGDKALIFLLFWHP